MKFKIKLFTLSCKAVSCCLLQWHRSCSKFCFDIDGFSFFNTRRQPTTIWWRAEDSVVCSASSVADWFARHLLLSTTEAVTVGTEELLNWMTPAELSLITSLVTCDTGYLNVFRSAVADVKVSVTSETAVQLLWSKASVLAVVRSWSRVTFVEFDAAAEPSSKMVSCTLSPPLPAHCWPVSLSPGWISTLSFACMKSFLPTTVPVISARRRSSIWCCWCRWSVCRRSMCLRNSAQNGTWQMDESTVQARACVTHSAISCWQTVQLVRSVHARAWYSTSIIFLHSGWRGHFTPSVQAAACATVSMQRWITSLVEAPDLVVARLSVSTLYFIISCSWPYFS